MKTINKISIFALAAALTLSTSGCSGFLDEDLKKDFDGICNELGITMSTAIIMLAKKMTREKRIPFEVSVDPFYSEENMSRLRKSIAQMEHSGGTVHEVDTDD